MKKIIILLFNMFLLFSCVEPNSNNDAYVNVVDGDTQSINHCPTTGFEMHDLNYKGELHQFIIYYESHRGGIAHWPGCKYCKINKAK